MKIYTRGGDTGETGLYGGGRVGKDNERMHVCGTLDECSAVLGLAAAHCNDCEARSAILRLQGEMLELGADVGTPLSRGSVVPRITAGHTQRLEREIDALDEELEPLRQFILPGGTPAGAFAHHARTVARRAERHLAALAQADAINPDALVYLNRVSDYLFTLARVINARVGTTEPVWERPGS